MVVICVVFEGVSRGTSEVTGECFVWVMFHVKLFRCLCDMCWVCMDFFFEVNQ